MKNNPRSFLKTFTKNFLKYFLKIFGSLKLTVGLLAAATVLIFVATLDQAQNGLRHAMTHYIEAWIGQPIPIPGGYLIGLLAILNLSVAYWPLFQKRKVTLGILSIHTGILLLVISSFVAGFIRTEGQMWIREGEKSNAVEMMNDNELVLIEKLPEGRQKVYSINAKSLREGKILAENHGLPVKIEILKFLKNAQIGPREKNTAIVRDASTLIVSRIGRPLFARSQLSNPQGYLKDSDWLIFEKPETFKETEINAPAAIVKVEGVGEFALSNLLGESFMPQKFSINDKTYEIALRIHRRHLPFKLHLNDFKFERYRGTDIPKNFQSDVEVWENDKEKVRTATIWMNNPLRYSGYTLYQASFDNKTETSTMLMVVKDASNALPYLAVALVSFGLLWHFIRKFFLPRR